MNIKTEQHPWSVYDPNYWTALDDDTYDGPGSPVGAGHTEREAINDLVEQTMERLEEKIDGLRWENRCLRAEIRGMMVTYGEIPPRTLREDDHQRVFPWEAMSGEGGESPSPTRGDMEEDREPSRRFQGRMSDAPPVSHSENIGNPDYR